MTNVILGRAVLQLSALLFCLVVALFIVPLIIERVSFYIPRLSLLVKEGAVLRRSVAVTISEVLGWAVIVVMVYVFLWFSYPEVFRLVTVAPVALLAWGVGLINLMWRFARFNKVVKREFYYSAYMHYITPEALQAYQVFIEDLDEMNNAELQEQAQKGRAIPYMHRQAVHRKMGERGILESWKKYTEKLNTFGLLSLRDPAKDRAGPATKK